MRRRPRSGSHRVLLVLGLGQDGARLTARVPRGLWHAGEAVLLGLKLRSGRRTGARSTESRKSWTSARAPFSSAVRSPTIRAIVCVLQAGGLRRLLGGAGRCTVGPRLSLSLSLRRRAFRPTRSFPYSSLRPDVEQRLQYQAHVQLAKTTHDGVLRRIDSKQIRNRTKEERCNSRKQESRRQK